MQWRIPTFSDCSLPSPPNWRYIALMVLLFLLLFALYLFWQPEHVLLTREPRWAGLLLFPAVCSVAIVTAAVHLWQERWLKVASHNLVLQQQRYLWRWQARSHLIIRHAKQLSANPELALNMMELVGTSPMVAADTLFRFPLATEDTFNTSRLKPVLTTLLNAIASYPSLTEIKAVTLYSNLGSQQSEKAFQAACKALTLMRLAQCQLTLLSDLPSPKLLNDLMESDWEGEHLVLLVQLQTPSEPKTNECALSLLFASGKSSRYQKQDKRLYPALSSSRSQLEEDIALLLDSEQLDKSRLRHIWMNSLDKAAQTLVNSALKQSETSAVPKSYHSLDQAIGKTSALHGWLAWVLAAEALEYGQGTQLIAQQHEDNIWFNSLSARPLPPLAIPEDELPRIPVYLIVTIALVVVGITLLVGEREIQRQLLPWFSAIFFFSSLACIGLWALKRIGYRRLFQRIWDRAQQQQEQS